MLEAFRCLPHSDESNTPTSLIGRILRLSCGERRVCLEGNWPVLGRIGLTRSLDIGGGWCGDGRLGGDRTCEQNQESRQKSRSIVHAFSDERCVTQRSRTRKRSRCDPAGCRQKAWLPGG